MASLYLDNDVTIHLAPILRNATHQVVTARDHGQTRASDAAQLLHAAQRDWILVTHNARHFMLLHDAWRRWSAAWGTSAQHSGILILPQATAAERLGGLMNAFDLAQMLIDILGFGAPIANELWRWHRGPGWVRQS